MEKILMMVLQSISFVVVMEDFCSVHLQHKKIKNLYYLFLWMIYFIYHLGAMAYIQSMGGKLIGNLILVFGILCLSYDAKLREKLIVEALGMFLLSAVEVILYMTVTVIEPRKDMNNPIYGIVSNILFWGLGRLLFGMIKNEIEEEDKKKYTISLGVVILVNGILGLIIENISIRANDEIVRSLTWVLVFILLLIDVIGFKIYGLFVERFHIRKENQAYLLQLELNDKEMAEKQAVMDDIKRMRHDMKNQLIYVQELIENNPQKAYKYVENLVGETNKMDIANSGNLTMDALVNYKYSLAKKYGITMQVNLNIPEKIPQSSSDICIILGNLFDNAIEAVRKEVSEKWIDVEITYEHNKLVIKIKNPYNGDVQKDGQGNYITKKSDKENHGIGLASIKKCVEKNHGILLVDILNHIFEITIII